MVIVAADVQPGIYVWAPRGGGGDVNRLPEESGNAEPG